jgi:hypothetical protein
MCSSGFLTESAGFGVDAGLVDLIRSNIYYFLSVVCVWGRAGSCVEAGAGCVETGRNGHDQYA